LAAALSLPYRADAKGVGINIVVRLRTGSIRRMFKNYGKCRNLWQRKSFSRLKALAFQTEWVGFCRYG
jgi:hypothetical protein